MSLSILNNISALQAENQLQITSAAAAKSLQQLSSGSRINSGADDAAGLAISDGLNANVAALNQSSLNATNAVGALQTTDGALAQITSLLNRSVTLATEASNSGLSASQSKAIDTEFQALLTQITNISGNTSFNGSKLFGSTVTAFTSDGTNNVLIGNDIAKADSAALGLGTASVAGTPNTVVTLNSTTATDALTPDVTPGSPTAAETAARNAAAATDASAGVNDAIKALAVISTAISTISAQRGTLGATVEQLQAASTVNTNESQNLTSASSSITSADISQVVANDTKYSILQQTGISALQQSNQQAQNVLKLLQ